MIKPYYQDNGVTQYCSDALSVLEELPDESIDLLVTDPPYGIGFMGKSWDKALASKLLGRRCIGIEINEEYCEIASKRCSQGVMELKI